MVVELDAVADDCSVNDSRVDVMSKLPRFLFPRPVRRDDVVCGPTSGLALAQRHSFNDILVRVINDLQPQTRSYCI